LMAGGTDFRLATVDAHPESQRAMTRRRSGSRLAQYRHKSLHGNQPPKVNGRLNQGLGHATEEPRP
jgi:hypothetical protein